MRRAAALAAFLVTALLAPERLWAQGWQDLSPRQRYDALRNYREHEQLPRERQDEIEKRYERWQTMPETERDRIRRNYERYRALPSPEREQFQRKYERWKRSQDNR
jgi:hypothetical protein